MKKSFILFALIGFSTLLPTRYVQAGNPTLHYPTPPEAHWQGDSLVVRFSSQLSGSLSGPLSLHVIPLYVSGNDTIRYPEVGYFTPSGARYYRRQETFADTKTSGDVQVVSHQRRPQPVDYQQRMAIPRSYHGKLLLQQVLRSCCDDRLLASETVAVPERAVVILDTVYRTVELTGNLLPPPIAAVSVPLFETNVTFIKPKAETIKERTAVTTIHINYPVNDWKVYPEFSTNAAELARVDKILSPVTSDPTTYRVLTVSIVGYASPEDTYEHNMTLSEKRAGGMRDYLKERYGFPTQQVSVQGKGEDWNGLREAVEKSDMRAKAAVLEIIDSYDIFDGREKRLMDLQGGEPYKYMLQTLFPPLRRMEMEIDHRVRAFKPDEAGELIGNRPQDLSLQEMYEVAQAENNDQTIRRQRNEYGREYDIAVRYFPDDDIANINASSAALVRGDLELAWLCLGRVKDNPLAANNLGVYHWLCGKIPEAKQYFLKAQETDPERAAYNLDQLQKWEAEFGHSTDEETKP